jgi:hypothetical protein
MDEKSKDYFVAYLDVLGFTDMVFANDSSRIDTYQQTLEREILTLINEKFDAIQFLTISDTAVMLIEYAEENKIENLRKLLQAVQEVQVIFAKKDIWIRGAVSLGKVWFDKKRNILIGQGYVNALLLEKEAIYPRVIIDPRIVLFVSNSAQTFKLQYNDGIAAPNDRRRTLIYPFVANANENGEKFIEDDSLFVCYGSLLVKDLNSSSWQELYTNIKNNLYSNQKTYHKYLWLKKYLAHCLFDAKGHASSTINPNMSSFLHNCFIQIRVL